MFKTSNKENESRCLLHFRRWGGLGAHTRKKKSRCLLVVYRANAVKNLCKIEREAPVHWSPMKSSIN